jgi:hypothetical protein
MLHWLGEQYALSALGDVGIGIEGKDRQHFDSLVGSERHAAGADRQLLLRAGMPGADLRSKFAANENLLPVQPDRCAST